MGVPVDLKMALKPKMTTYVVEYYVLCVYHYCVCQKSFRLKNCLVSQEKGQARKNTGLRVRRSPFLWRCRCLNVLLPVGLQGNTRPFQPTCLQLGQKAFLVLALKLHEPTCGSTAPLYICNRNGFEMDGFPSGEKQQPLLFFSFNLLLVIPASLIGKQESSECPAVEYEVVAKSDSWDDALNSVEMFSVKYKLCHGTPVLQYFPSVPREHHSALLDSSQGSKTWPSSSGLSASGSPWTSPVPSSFPS